jgi:iron complex outermembrane receptor protein
MSKTSEFRSAAKATLAASASVAVLLGATGSAAAAEQDGDAGSTAQVEEVLVTAQKRSENLQQVPIAITAITAKTLSSAATVNTEDLAQFVPGLLVGKTSAGGQTYLRGVGQGTGVPGAESPVATYLDGIYLGAPALGVFDLNNVSQIAVLKGPQGTLFGRNATGGLIQIVTNTPSSTPSGKLDVGYGNYKTFTGHLYVTGPITDDLSASLAISGKDRENGYIRNVYTGHDLVDEKSYTVQSKWLWTVSPSTDVELNVLHGDYRNLNGSIFAVYPGATASDGVTKYLGSHTISNRTDVPNESQNSIASLRLNHDFGVARLMSLTASTDFKSDLGIDQSAMPGTPNPNNARAQLADLHSSIHEFSQELQLQAPAGQDFQWIAGLFYFQDLTKIRLKVRLDDTPVATTFTRLDTTSYSAFLQGTKTIFPDTRLTLGLRYTSDTRKFSGLTNTGASPAAGLPNQKTWGEPTWRVALDHSFTPDLLGYVSYNRGFKSGNYSNTNVTNPPADPEIVDAYEAGLKSELLDNRLRLNVAAFYYDYKDIQLRSLEGASLIFFNAANSRVYGLDVDFNAVINEHLSVTGGFELLDAKYTRFPRGVMNLPTPIAAAPAGCTGAPNLRQGGTTTFVCDLSGNRMVKSPTFSGNLNVEYTWDTARGSFLVLAGDNYVSGYYGEPDNILKQRAYHWLTASIAWTSPDERTSVKLWGTNIGNARVFSSVATGASTYFYEPGQPPMYGITLGRAF